MKILILFSTLLVLSLSFEIPNDNCVYDVNINSKYYVLVKTYHIGNVFAADAHFDNFGNLFFVKSGRSAKGFFFDIYIIRNLSKIPRKIEGLPKGLSYSIAIDRKNSDVYFGTSHGIFKYDYIKGTALQHSDSKLKLDMIFIDNDANKFVTEHFNGVEELYLLDDREKKIRYNVLESFHELAIDSNNNFYYLKDNHLYMLRSSSMKPVRIGDVSYNGIAQISIYKDTLYVASNKLSYFEGNMMQLKTAEKAPQNLTAVAFDVTTGDFILGTYARIFKYKRIDCYYRN